MAQDHDPDHDPKTGRFTKGNKPKGRRAPGTPNKINRTTKEAMDAAANVLGGKEGKTGVFIQAGQKDIVGFAKMLAQSMPLEIQAALNVASTVNLTINPVPTNRYLTPQQIRQQLGLPEPEPPPVIEVLAPTEPIPQVDEPLGSPPRQLATDDHVGVAWGRPNNRRRRNSFPYE